MSCPIRNIPQFIKDLPKSGNKGVNFPLEVDCGVLEQRVAQNCYLALELGNDPFFGSPLVLEAVNGLGLIAAPCTGEVVFCFLADEETGTRAFFLEESDEDFIAVNCSDG